jgi:REP element-mobilizing transposase RayT
MALAFFITFRTYGTWLHGDENGSVDREHNVYGTPLLEPDEERKRQAMAAMTQPEYVMSRAEADIVCRALVDLAEERGWELLAAHVRTNHVHVVIHAEREAGRLMSDLKARASRELTSAGFGDSSRKRWSRHGSTRHLFRDKDIDEAIRYALDEQGARMACYFKEPRTH